MYGNEIAAQHTLSGAKQPRDVTQAESLVDRLGDQVSHLSELTSRLEGGIDRFIGSQPSNEKVAGSGGEVMSKPPLFQQLEHVSNRLAYVVNKFEDQLQRLNSI